MVEWWRFPGCLCACECDRGQAGNRELGWEGQDSTGQRQAAASIVGARASDDGVVLVVVASLGCGERRGAKT